MNVPDLVLVLALQEQFNPTLKRIQSVLCERTPSRSHALSRESIDAYQPQPPTRKETLDGETERKRRAAHVSLPAFVCDSDTGNFAPPDIRTPQSAPDTTVMALPPTTKGWTPKGLVALGKRMEHVPRVSAVKNSERLGEIIKEYEESGVPLIIEDWDKTPVWPGEKLFGVEWLLEHGDEMIAVRNCVTCRDKEISFKEFIEKSRTIPEYAQEGEDERLYGKDAVCPKEWREWLMNDNLPDVLKPGSSEDVLELLPEPERVETLMCYYGIGDTFTAAHKDLCASSGHNLMCHTEHGGSAFWFMMRSSDAARAALYFQTLGADLDHETHVATPEEFAKVPFTVYVAEQKLGDLVLVPRRSCHQVVNHGGITAKMSWSRMTIEGLSTAFHHELPIYRRVCRSETYRVKLLVYRALLKYTEDLAREQEQLKASIPAEASITTKVLPERAASRSSTLTPLSSPGSSSGMQLPTLEENDETSISYPLSLYHEKLVANVRILLSVFDKILKEEHASETQCEMHNRRSHFTPIQENANTLVDSSNGTIPFRVFHDGLTCDFCGTDIFQSFFECRRCPGSTARDDNIIICPSCYAEGRSCSCAIMTPVQQFPMDILFEAQNRAAKLLNFEGYGRNVIKAVPLSHQVIGKAVDHPGIFSAACQLLRIRAAVRAKQPTLVCRYRGNVSHRVPAAGAITCKKCHSARCFRHILADGYHVVDALKQHSRGVSHENWHSCHKSGPKRLAAARPAVLKAEEAGGPCDMSVSLVLHAERFPNCRPVCDKAKPGWYDSSAYIKLEEDHASESSVEGFTGPVLGESDEDIDDSISDTSSSEASEYGVRARKRPKITLRIDKRKVLNRELPLPQSPPTLPSQFLYVLVDKLRPEEKEKYYARPNIITMRMPKGSPKKPPGIPANEVPRRRRGSQPKRKTPTCYSSDDDGAIDIRQFKVGPPVGVARVQDPFIPKRKQKRQRTSKLAPPVSANQDVTLLRNKQKLPIREDTSLSEVSKIMVGSSNELESSKSTSCSIPAELARPSVLSSGLPSVPQTPIDTISVPSASRAVAKLLQNPRKTEKYADELVEMRNALKETRKLVDGLKEIIEDQNHQLQRVKTEVENLTLQNKCLWQQLNARLPVTSSAIVSGNSCNGDCTQPVFTPPHNHVQTSPMKRKPIKTYLKDKESKPVSGIIPRKSPLPPVPRSVTLGNASPDILENSIAMSRKKIWERTAGESCSTPLRRDHISNKSETPEPCHDAVEVRSVDSDAGPLHEGAPMTPSDKRSRPLFEDLRRVTGIKRRRCSDAPSPPPLQMPQRTSAGGEVYLSLDEPVTPRTPVRAVS